VISTGTKNLQEQLFYKDIPFLQKHLPSPIQVCYMKGRNNFASPVPPFQGGEDLFLMFTWGFTPGYHLTGFQPSEQRRIVAEVDALKRLQAETGAELAALLQRPQRRVVSEP